MNREMGDDHESSPVRQSTHWPAAIRVVAYLIAAGIVTFPIVYLFNLARAVNDSEYKLHALRLTADLVEQYMRAHDDQWPTSWDDLQDVQFEKQPPTMFEWPGDATKIKERARIDFDVTADQLADPSFKVTAVIAPIGEYVYDPTNHLQTLQHYIDTRRNEGAFASAD